LDEVHRILARTLLASPHHDEARQGSVQLFFDNIPKVRWEIFENSSRMPFVEEPERYFEVVGSFFAEHD
jgi:L-proline amide hydrolase